MKKNYLYILAILVTSIFNTEKAEAQLLTNDNVNITINSGFNLTVKGDIQNQNGTTITNSGTIDLSGNWINNSGNNCFGTSQGQVTFNGGAQTIGGSSSTVFNNLSLSSSTKTLLINTTIGGGNASPSGTLSLGGSVLDLNSKTLSITNPNAGIILFATSYILSEDADNSSKIKWTINNATGVHTIPFGNAAGKFIPFTFNLTGGNAGDVTVSTYATAADNTSYPAAPDLVTHVRNNTGVDNSNSTVDRFWQVNTTGTPTAALTFTWAVGENALNGNLNPRAQRWVSPAAGWEIPIGGQVNPTSQSVLVSGVTAFGPWAVALQSSPLPIELLSFTASPVDNKEVLCRWITSSEINNDYFTLERSANATSFEPVTEVEGAGNSTSQLTYSFTDELPYKGVSYYRLKQTDFDGRFSYSEVVAVNLNSRNSPVSVFPNPATSAITITLPENAPSVGMVEFYDAAGRKVLSEQINQPQQAESYLFNVSVENLEPGIYHYRLISGDNFYAEGKIIVQR